ncbi:MAG: hypothetical protein ACI4LA_09270 [Emergencia sp.]
MMHTSRDYVEWELERQKEKEHLYEKRLQLLPEGRLKLAASKGSLYYLCIKDGKQIYLGDDNDARVKALKEKKFLETALRNIKENRLLMENYLRQYRPVNPEDVMKTLPKTYQTGETFGLAECVSGSRWESEPYEKSDAYPERLSHRTLKGDMVRSKSEAVIANMLYEQRIPYHYEELLKLGEDLIAPDFKIAVRSESRFKFLEHCGMLGDEKYLQTFVWKLRKYLAHGYLPWRDVFFTFDDFHGGIDTIAIREMLNHFFL